MKTIRQNYRPEFPTIRNIANLQQLIESYPNQKVLDHMRKLQVYFPYYRPIAGDGNCFYRAIAFLYLREASLDKFEKVFKQTQNVCYDHQLQFQEQTFLQRLQIQYEQKLLKLKDTFLGQREKKLAKLFNQSIIFDKIMILYFRSLNYNYIKKNQKTFRSFISNSEEIEGIRQFSRDSEGIQYEGMSKELQINLVFHIVNENEYRIQSFNSDKSRITYNLFLRPGHFDIPYQKSSKYLKSQSFDQLRTAHYSQTLKNSFTNPIRTKDQRYYKPTKNNYPRFQQTNHMFNNYQESINKHHQSSDKNYRELIKESFDKKSPKSISLQNNLKSGSIQLQCKDLFARSTNLRGKIKQKPAENDQFTQKIPNSSVKYKAWSLESESFDKMKQLREIIVLLIFLSIVIYLAYIF